LGALHKHPYELYQELNEIEHTKTKAKRPQTNGICERVHQTILNEFYRVAFRKKVYSDLETLRLDLDEYMNGYNRTRTQQEEALSGADPNGDLFGGKEVLRGKESQKTSGLT